MATPVQVPAEMVTFLRVLINDLGTPSTYTDSTLRQIISCGMQLVATQLDFTQIYVISIPNTTVAPDPTGNDPTAGRDDNFLNISIIKSACLVERMEVKIAAGQAIDIRDGRSAVSLKGAADARIRLLKINWCAEYDNAAEMYMLSKSHTVGAAVLTPFRVWASLRRIPMGGFNVSGFTSTSDY